MTKCSMSAFSLKSETRTVHGKKVAAYRKKGFVPAVLYGGKSKDAQSLLIPEKDFARVYRGAGESSLITLNVGADDVRNVLVHEVSLHPVTGAFMHIDFFEVRMDEKLKAKVPLVFTGESPAVKNNGGMLVRTLQEVEVECLPGLLPHEIAIDISALGKFHDAIRLRDLQMPEGVTLKGDADEVVATVEEPRSEKELEGLAGKVEEEAAISQIKSVKEEERKKKEEIKGEEAPADKK